MRLGVFLFIVFFNDSFLICLFNFKVFKIGILKRKGTVDGMEEGMERDVVACLRESRDAK